MASTRAPKLKSIFMCGSVRSDNLSLRCGGADVVAFPPHLGQIDRDGGQERNKQSSNAVVGLPFPASE